MNHESKVQAEILLAIGALPGVRIFRNTVGQGWHGQVVEHRGGLLTLRNPRRVTFGLMPGSPDLVGWHTVTITPDMVGQRIARFTGLEVKTGTGRASDGQRHFLNVLREAGGLAEVVTSPQQAAQLFGGRS